MRGLPRTGPRLAAALATAVITVVAAGGAPAAAAGSVATVDHVLTVSRQVVNAVPEGEPGTLTDTFTDAQGCPAGVCKPASSFSAVVNWGDGGVISCGPPALNPCAGTGNPRVVATTVSGCTAPCGAYSVQGDHVYADERSCAASSPGCGYQLSVTLTDNTLLPPGNSSTDRFALSVPDQPLGTGTGASFTVDRNQVFSGVLGQFHDGNQLATGTDFAVTINWGDATSGTGSATVGPCAASAGAAPAGCTVTVHGSHTYAKAGRFTVTVTARDGDNAPAGAGDSGSSIAFTATATVPVPGLPATLAPQGPPARSLALLGLGLLLIAAAAAMRRRSART